MKLDDKKLIRAIVRRVHPDLFSAHPYERAQNSESLKACTLLALFFHIAGLVALYSLEYDEDESRMFSCTHRARKIMPF